MTSQYKRTDRIAEMLQRELAQLITKEVRDPRMPAFVTISAVKVSADLSYAKVYFTVLNHDINETKDILNAAAGGLRSALARSVKLRTVPQLQFIYDESIEYGRRLSKLIDDVNLSEPDDANSSEEI